MVIYELGKIPESEYPHVGGKAKGLDQLVKGGFNVPAGFVITDTGEIGAADETEIIKAFDALNVSSVSVRSSATAEDGEFSSAAGQYDTFLFVKRDGVIASVKKCVASLNSVRANEYNSTANLRNAENVAGKSDAESGENRMNVVVQQMIDSKKAGVMFTVSPTDAGKTLIEAVAGQGENLVSGKVSATDYEISNGGFDGFGDETLSERELRAVYDVGRRVSERFYKAADIEWAIDGDLFVLQMRPITVEARADFKEFDRKDDVSNHLFTKRNVGEMMPGAVTPLTLTTSAKAIDYGIRYMFWKGGALKSVNEIPPLRMISSFSGHLFFDMQIMYQGFNKIAIANPQSMNLSIMGEYHDYPEVTGKRAPQIVRLINSLKFLRYVFSGRKSGKKLDALIPEIKFEKADTCAGKYRAIDKNLHYLDETLNYHYKASSYGGSTTSTLYMMLDKYFPDKNEYQAFMAEILSNIKGIESADILRRLQEISEIIKSEVSDAFALTDERILDILKKDGSERLRLSYAEFIKIHGHRSIKEAELRSKPWKRDEKALVKYLKSVMAADTVIKQGESEIDLKRKFSFCKGLLKKFAISYAKKARQAVVDREYSKSKMIKVIDLFKDRYAELAESLVAEKLLPDSDLIYFLTHEELKELIDGNKELSLKAKARRDIFDEQDSLSFDDIYVGRPVPLTEKSFGDGDVLRGVPVCRGKIQGKVCVVKSTADADKLKNGEIMVAKFTDIGWTPYYSKAAGLVTEIGSALSHGAVVAREYGLPTVVNVKGATTALKNGDVISVDATAGTVRVVKRAE